ncbi:putative 2-dehydropantoate 2-reductase [Geobacter pelophilus]|jgi:2-dehydropantoate 2-reductase|uniref:2-dehydropantoate 2-reductase n=1 Tax=Geoanaerobacter pelophilus TaxID=60036 RepID=A0AAW4L0A6_9BACT|nr:putative 2-dehydropantoate 2-reductase [Geoanaerobacter pelophilus]MBT0664366.1 putative 2-dehydropantoate 2-reductase [Geoanaerobacter pelophilus]
MRIAVVGSGALGLYYGALLQRAGNEVTFLLRRDYEAVSASGLTVRSINGDFKLDKVSAALRPEEIGETELVLVGLKTFANDSYQELIAPLVGDKTYILTLQNGLGNEELLAELFGSYRILGGVAFLCANRGEPGTVHHLGAGRIELGCFADAPESLLTEVAVMFRAAGVDCRQVRDLKSARWQKLVWNIPFNGLCTLLNAPVDRLLTNAATRSLVRDIMLEVIAAANAQGLQEPIPAEFAEKMLVFSDGMGPYRPSMLIDREEQRPLELDAIFARAVAAGAKSGVQLDKTSMLHSLLQFVSAEC